MADHQESIHNLTLMLMLLTSWRERPGELRRCWKGYDFEVLNSLADSGIISGSRGAKSAYLTLEGEQRASQLLIDFGIPLEEA